MKRPKYQKLLLSLQQRLYDMCEEKARMNSAYVSWRQMILPNIIKSSGSKQKIFQVFSSFSADEVWHLYSLRASFPWTMGKFQGSTYFIWGFLRRKVGWKILSAIQYLNIFINIHCMYDRKEQLNSQQWQYLLSSSLILRNGPSYSSQVAKQKPLPSLNLCISLPYPTGFCNLPLFCVAKEFVHRVLLFLERIIQRSSNKDACREVKKVNMVITIARSKPCYFLTLTTYLRGVSITLLLQPPYSPFPMGDAFFYFSRGSLPIS